MACILTRLPVKSLLRLMSVCKPWLELFATPRFIKMHYNQFSSYPINQSFIINSSSEFGKQTLSLVTLKNELADLHPPPVELRWRSMFCVGCLNGLVCLYARFDHKEGIVLWNPAMRLSKFVPIPQAAFSFPKNIWLGFGYDAHRDDFRVVKIITWRSYNILNELLPDYPKGNTTTRVDAGVYSTKSGTWIPIELPFHLADSSHRMHCNSAIVNGNPYWVGRIDKNKILKDGDDVLLWCDVTRLEFKIVPLSGLKVKNAAKVPFVEWKGSLAALLYTKSDERLESLDVWVFDDAQMVWTKNHTFGPIEMKVRRCMQCSKNGMIIGNCLDRKLFVLDPETRWVKEIEIGAHFKHYMTITGYSESLVSIKGMRRCVVKLDEEGEQAQE